MRKKKLHIIFVLQVVSMFFYSLPSSAQYEVANPENSEEEPITAPLKIMRPYLGLGTGMMAYYGDIRNPRLSKNPFTSRISSELFLGTELTKYLDLDFYVVFGKLSGNEFGNDRNLNFQSTVRTGGFLLTYDFENFYKNKKPTIQPFISIGLETVEYVTKTDLYDSKGRKYNYWSDGSIRSLPENHPNAGLSELLIRDYIYETDVREQNIDGYGPYNEQGLALPIGGGIKMNLTDRLSFRVSSIAHIAFTDVIDGITPESIGNRAGNQKRDWFLVNSASISYNLHFKVKKKSRDAYKYNEEDLNDVDYLALMNDDSDGDGIRDFDDNCPDTPPGVEVDKFGCPLDTDKDGVPDYLDEEPNTAAGAIVDRKGVTMTDEDIMAAYKMFSDSIGAFSVTTRTQYQTALKDPDMPTFRVQIGKFGASVPQDFINKVLSISDISSNKSDDNQTIYSVGKYSAIDAAKNRKKAMEEMGFADVKIIVEKRGKIYAEDEPQFEQASKYTRQARPASSGSYYADRGNKTDASGNVGNTPKVPSNILEREVKADKRYFDDAKPMPITDELIYRVQIGTHSRKVNDNRYGNVPDLVTVTKDDGLTRYLGGSFKTYNQAANLKADLVSKGFDDAFVVAYKNGERVSLQTLKNEVTLVENYVDPVTQKDKNQLTFRVQIGAFRNVTEEFSAETRGIEGVQSITLSNGITRFVAGNFKSYNEAENLRKKVINSTSLKDAFIVAYYDGNPIPLQQALQILNQ
jgi:cell division protein FtsN